MANTTIYPYGTNGQLPSSIGVINDLVTGGADKALSAEMGKELGSRTRLLDIDDADLALIDESGNIAIQVFDGQVKTQNFDSRQVSTNTVAIQQLRSQIGNVGGSTDIKVKNDDDAAFDIADENGKVALRITSAGHIQTKNFNSAAFDIFRQMKLDEPQCVCHGYGAATGQANTIAYFRNGISKGYKFFECDAVNCSDGVPVCTHAYSSYSVKRKSDNEVVNIQLSEISSTDLTDGYTWADGEAIATLNEVIWFICYFHRFPLHVDGQGMTKASRYAASQYAESLGVGQYVFHELEGGTYNDWDIPCNAIIYPSSVADVSTKASLYKRANNNILFYVASTSGYTDATIKSYADAAHSAGCYLVSWTFANVNTVRNWFRLGADFLLTSGIVNNDI